MLHVIAKFSVKDECIEDFKNKAKKLVEETQKEDGSRAYDLFESIKEPNVLTFIEVWDNMEALELHRQTDHYKEIVPVLKAYAAQNFQVDIYNQL